MRVFCFFFFNVVAFATLSKKKKAVSIFSILINGILEVRSQVLTHRLRNLRDQLVQPLYFIN